MKLTLKQRNLFDPVKGGLALPPEENEPEDITHGAPLRGQLTDVAALRRYLEAGRAIVTIRSKVSSTRFTFKVARPSEEEHVARQAQYPAYGALRERPMWVNLLRGPDNTRDYQFVGTVWPEAGQYRYAHSPKSQIGLQADSVAALRWVLHALNTNPTLLFAQAEVWHEGRCGRCGRRLTVPESIDTGFGPECAGVLGLRS